jgi:uncharacterized cupredoxin-like copper-binding protein
MRLFTMRTLLIFISLCLAFSCLTACSSGGGTATTVTVTLTDFTITSSLTNFQVNVPYHFVVTNTGAVAHQMLIMPPMDASATADQVKAASLAGIGGDGLAAGQTQNFDYTFTAAAPSGKLELACHIAGHYEAGMHLGIVVQ